MKLRNSLSFTAALALMLAPQAFAQSQQQQPPPKPPEQKEQSKAPAKKPKKVWGEDDVKDLRKPWDEHADQKRAEADAKAAEDAKAAAATEQGKDAQQSAQPGQQPAEDFLPKTVDEAEKRLAEKREEINFQVELIAQTRTEYFNSSDDAARQKLTEKIEKLNSELEEARAELKQIEGRLEQLRAKPAATPPAAEKPPARPDSVA